MWLAIAIVTATASVIPSASEGSPYDLAIIGAGILGVLSAYEISKRKPNWRILIVDRSLIGFGATHYSLGAQFPFGNTPVKSQLTQQSIKGWEELQNEIPDLPIKNLSYYGLCHQENIESLMPKFVDPKANLLRLDAMQEFKQEYPDILVSENQRIIASRDAGVADVLSVTLKISSVLQKNKNIDLYEGIAIEDIVIENIENEKNIILKTSLQQHFHTDRVLLTTGPWITTGWMQNIAKDAQIRTKKIVSFHILRPPERESALLFFHDEQAFLLPDVDRSRWLFSFTAQEWDLSPESSRLVMSSLDFELGISLLQKYCPAFVPYFRGGRVFCDAYSTTLEPLIFEIPDKPNIYVAGAGSGSGFRLAPAIVRQLCEHFF